MFQMLIEVGGVEYLVNARDDQAYFYDINAVSNFVANAPEVVGFDPFPWAVVRNRAAPAVRYGCIQIG
jgi:hypothetical protein